MNILAIALAPVVVILIYIYIRDKYEKEPFGLLLKAFFAGAVAVVPILFAESILSARGANLGGYTGIAYHAFVVAAFTIFENNAF